MVPGQALLVKLAAKGADYVLLGARIRCDVTSLDPCGLDSSSMIVPLQIPCVSSRALSKHEKMFKRCTSG